jgi:hypothetical protein
LIGLASGTDFCYDAGEALQRAVPHNLLLLLAAEAAHHAGARKFGSHQPEAARSAV